MISLLKTVFRITALSCCYFLAVGCVRMEDLSVKNKYNFPITVKHLYKLKDGTAGFSVIGTVPANSTKLFEWGIRKGGYWLDDMTIEDRNSKTLEKLKRVNATETSKSGGCTGARTTWHVTVAPKSSPPSAVVSVSLKAK